MNQDYMTDPGTVYEVRSWAERNGFSHWAVALIWLIIAFVLFQIVAGVVFFILMLASGDLGSVGDTTEFLMDRLDLLFIGNSSGQILLLGLATFFVVRFSTAGESKKKFLRIGTNQQTGFYILTGAVLMVAIQPLIIYLGFLNSLLPIPESLTEFQISQYEMIEEFLRTDGVIWFALFHVAVVPAFCEEILFRGYILRAFEKSWGISAAIVVSGIVFGLFHLQLGNLMPLATLGIILAVMTWLSGSLWPAVAAHFINNGSAVLLGTRFPDLAFGEVTAETLPPAWLLIVSMVLSAGIIYMMLKKQPDTNPE